jgi:hypothetical protein
VSVRRQLLQRAREVAYQEATPERLEALREAIRQAESLYWDQDDEDDEDQAECSDCERVVFREEPYFATPCGTFCAEHMRDHVAGCGVCRSEFSELAEDDED